MAADYNSTIHRGPDSPFKKKVGKRSFAEVVGDEDDEDEDATATGSSHPRGSKRSTQLTATTLEEHGYTVMVSLRFLYAIGIAC
jgi:hypothetical protein